MADRASRNGSPPQRRSRRRKRRRPKAKAETSAKKKPAKRDLLGWIMPIPFADAIGAGVVGTIHIATKPRAPSVARVKPTNEDLGGDLPRRMGVTVPGTVTCWVAGGRRVRPPQLATLRGSTAAETRSRATMSAATSVGAVAVVAK